MIDVIFEESSGRSGPKRGIVVLHSGEPLKELEDLQLFSEEKNAMLADYFAAELSEGNKLSVVCLGIGEWIVISLKKAAKRPLFGFRNAGGVAVDYVRKYKLKEISLVTENLNSAQVAAVVDGLVLGDYCYAEADGKTAGKASCRTLRCSTVKDLDKTVVDAASVTAAATNTARRIADTPANVITPTAFASLAEKLAKKESLGCKIIGEVEMKELGMDAILAVSQGSAEEAKLICLEYKHPEAKKTLAMVGKGLTFDAGGISLKQAAGMMLMKYDKCGGTSVYGAIAAVAKLKLKVNVVALIPCSENLLGAKAYKPGDVIGSYAGKTIEIANTDAEGRLILADALAYAVKKYKPDAMANLATLTGAVNVALGRGGSAVAGTSDQLCQDLVAAGAEVDELLWQMPIWDAHEELLKSGYADIVNMKEGGEAGLPQGYTFLKHFVGETDWAALDIAATSWKYRGGDYIKGEGASGFGVRTLVQWAQSQSEY